MSALHKRLEASLKSRADRQILRSLVPSLSIAASPQPLIDFSSNDYLSFGSSDELRRKLLEELVHSPHLYGPPSSRLLDGNTRLHLAVEADLARFFEGPSGLLFNSGFDANVSLWTTLPAPDDYILYDELIHASTHDGMRSSRTRGTQRRPFSHNCLIDLKRAILGTLEDTEVTAGRRSVWITTETLFSMDGDLAPVKEMIDLVETLLPLGNGHWVIDEVGLVFAHARDFND